MSDKRTYRVKFNDVEYTRRSEHNYPYATYRYNCPLSESVVKFHKTRQAANRRPGLTQVELTYHD